MSLVAEELHSDHNVMTFAKVCMFSFVRLVVCLTMSVGAAWTCRAARL